MTRSPTISPAAETTTPPQTSGSAAPRPSPPGPTSPAAPWLHNHAHRPASLNPSRLPLICRCQVDGACRPPRNRLGMEADAERSLTLVLALPLDQLVRHRDNIDGFAAAACFADQAVIVAGAVAG